MTPCGGKAGVLSSARRPAANRHKDNQYRSIAASWAGQKHAPLTNPQRGSGTYT